MFFRSQFPVRSEACTGNPGPAHRFSSFTVKQANKLGVTGFVQNEDDGSVSPQPRQCCIYRYLLVIEVGGEAQADNDAIKKFLKALEQGPSMAEVNGVEKSDMDTKDGESGFEQSG